MCQSALKKIFADGLWDNQKITSPQTLTDPEETRCGMPELATVGIVLLRETPKLLPPSKSRKGRVKGRANQCPIYRYDLHLSLMSQPRPLRASLREEVAGMRGACRCYLKRVNFEIPGSPLLAKEPHFPQRIQAKSCMREAISRSRQHKLAEGKTSPWMCC